MEYNTKREHLRLREYGRNIQKLVEYACSVDDTTKQQKTIEDIISIMGNINPHLRNVEDFKHLLWDHLHIMADFKLEDVQSPYPIPDKELIYQKPSRFPYPKKNNRYRHYGKNILSLISKANEIDDADKKQAFAECIANYMKMVHANWNRENVNDEIIKNDLESISNGSLTLNEETILRKATTQRRPSSNDRDGRRGGRNGGKRHSNGKRRNYPKK